MKAPTMVQRWTVVTETFEPTLPAPTVAVPVVDGDVAGDVAEGVDATPPDVTDTPEGRAPVGTLAETEVELSGVEVADKLGTGSVTVAPGGRVTLVEGSPVWCGGSVFELELEAAWIFVGDGTAEEEGESLPRIVNVGLMLPELPKTGA